MKEYVYVLKNPKDLYAVVDPFSRNVAMLRAQKIATRFTKDRATNFIEKHPSHQLRAVRLRHQSAKSRRRIMSKPIMHEQPSV